MKALLLAAGLGTRLRPFTFLKAKASLPLQQLPFIHFSLQYLAANGIQDVVINLHAHADSVKSAVKEFRGRMNVQYSYEPAILGTAGAIRKAAPLMDSDFFVVMNGDMLTEIRLQDVIDQHMQSGAFVTLVIMRMEPDQKYGGLYFDGDPLRLTGIKSGSGEKYHYTGLQIVSHEIIHAIAENQKLEVFTHIYPQWIAEGRIQGFLYNGLWKEIGTLREYLSTSIDLCNEPLPAHLQPEGAVPELVSPKAIIEPNAKVTDSILMDGSIVKAGSQIEQSIIGWDATASGSIKNIALARGILPWHIMQ